MMGFWLKDSATGGMQYSYGPVSAYVGFHKFEKGRKRKDTQSVRYDFE